MDTYPDGSAGDDGVVEGMMESPRGWGCTWWRVRTTSVAIVVVYDKVSGSQHSGDDDGNGYGVCNRSPSI